MWWPQSDESSQDKSGSENSVRKSDSLNRNLKNLQGMERMMRSRSMEELSKQQQTAVVTVLKTRIARSLERIHQSQAALHSFLHERFVPSLYPLKQLGSVG